MTKKRRKIKTGPIIILFCLAIFGILIYCIYDITSSLKSKGTSEVKILNTIEEYGYTLNENDSAYVSEIFGKLKQELENEIVDEEKYATYVSQLFIADFYTLNSAINKNDIGGVQFVYESYQSDFESSAKDTVYRYIENNIYNDRTQDLPIVTDVSITNIEQKMYNSDAITDAKAFYVTAKVTYKENLEYPTEVSLILVHNDKKLEIAQMK
jgi:hypothetical protein